MTYSNYPELPLEFDRMTSAAPAEFKVDMDISACEVVLPIEVHTHRDVISYTFITQLEAREVDDREEIILAILDLVHHLR